MIVFEFYDPKDIENTVFDINTQDKLKKELNQGFFTSI